MKVDKLLKQQYTDGKTLYVVTKVEKVKIRTQKVLCGGCIVWLYGAGRLVQYSFSYFKYLLETKKLKTA